MKKNRSKTMKHSGAWCLVIGITTLTIGIACGVGNIVNGAHLLSKAE